MYKMWWTKRRFPLYRSFTNHSPLICKGEEPDLLFQYCWHITINVDGGIIVDFDDFEVAFLVFHVLSMHGNSDFITYKYAFEKQFEEPS